MVKKGNERKEPEHWFEVVTKGGMPDQVKSACVKMVKGHLRAKGAQDSVTGC